MHPNSQKACLPFPMLIYDLIYSSITKQSGQSSSHKVVISRVYYIFIILSRLYFRNLS